MLDNKSFYRIYFYGFLLFGLVSEYLLYKDSLVIFFVDFIVMIDDIENCYLVIKWMNGILSELFEVKVIGMFCMINLW